MELVVLRVAQVFSPEQESALVENVKENLKKQKCAPKINVQVKITLFLS